MSVRRATISDVAKAAGVSIGAVSRILNKDPSINVREETRRAVHRAMTELGYSPNPHARSLRTARTGSLAMILPEIDSPAFAAIIQGAQKAAYERGYSLLVGGVGPDADDPELPARLLQRNRVDGFLVSSGLREAETLDALRNLDAPSVLLNRYLDDEHPHVIMDDEAGVAAVVQYLIELGHRDIGFLGSPSRFLGMRRVAGVPPRLVRGRHRPTACVCARRRIHVGRRPTHDGGPAVVGPATDRGVRDEPPCRGGRDGGRGPIWPPPAPRALGRKLLRRTGRRTPQPGAHGGALSTRATRLSIRGDVDRPGRGSRG